MKFIWLLITLYVTNVACGGDTTINGYLDKDRFDVIHDNAAMWKKLFLKLNAMSGEMEKLSQGQAYLNQRFEELSKSLEQHTNRSPRSVKNDHEILGDFHKRQKDLIENVQEIQGLFNQSQTALMESIQEFRGDFNTRQDTQEHFLRQIFSYNHEWTTILSRNHYGVNNGSWNLYKSGYSDNGFYFIGLESLYLRTTYESDQELMIILKDWNGQTRYAKYDRFQVGDESEQYALKIVGKYKGNAGDSLLAHQGHKFSTYDRDNDENDQMNCASDYGAGWWFFGDCKMSLLSGPYRYEEDSKTWGVSWSSWRGWNYSLKSVEMMIRPTL